MDILLWTLWEILLFPFAFWVLLKLLGNWYVSLRQKYQLVTNMFLWTNLIMIPHCWFCWNNFNWLAISLKLLLPKTIVLIRKLCTLSGRKAMWLSFNCLCIELAHTVFFFFLIRDLTRNSQVLMSFCNIFFLSLASVIFFILQTLSNKTK